MSCLVLSCFVFVFVDAVVVVLRLVFCLSFVSRVLLLSFFCLSFVFLLSLAFCLLQFVRVRFGLFRLFLCLERTGRERKGTPHSDPLSLRLRPRLSSRLSLPKA